MSRFIRVLATACAATARIQDRDVICGGRDIHRAGALGITLSRAAFWVLHFPTSGVIDKRENRTPVKGLVRIQIIPCATTALSCLIHAIRFELIFTITFVDSREGLARLLC